MHPWTVAVVGDTGQGYYGSAAALREEPVKFVQGRPEGRVGEPALGILRIFCAEPAPQAVPLREFPVGPGILQIRELGSAILISPMSSPVIRQWHTPILVESARSNLDPRRRVATDPLGFVDAAHHLCDHDRLKTGIDEVLEAGGVLNVTLNDIIEHFVGW